jgi:hypothetical protein
VISQILNLDVESAKLVVSHELVSPAFEAMHVIVFELVHIVTQV